MKFGINDIDKYAVESGGNYFQLKDDGNTAKVRFMYNEYTDLEGYAVHEIEVGGRKRYVSCLRNYNEPLSVCPFCEAKMKAKAKLFINLYNIDDDKVETWERGASKKFLHKLESLFVRYNPLCSQIIEIERQGKKGDMQTDYAFFPLEKDNTRLEDLPDKNEIIGNNVLERTADEMRYFLDNGDFENVSINSNVQKRERPETARTESTRIENTGNRNTGRETRRSF